jgi:hypothetical protein
MWEDGVDRPEPWKIDYFPGRDGKTYIRVFAGNGEKVARSNRGFDKEGRAMLEFLYLQARKDSSTARAVPSSDGKYVARAGDPKDADKALYFTSETLVNKAYADEVARRLQDLF